MRRIRFIALPLFFVVAVFFLTGRSFVFPKGEKVNANKSIDVEAQMIEETASNAASPTPTAASSTAASATPIATATLTPTPHLSSTPRVLSIPKIHLNAPIIISGKLSDGAMYVPPDNKTIGWWKYGKFPGQMGTAVLAGHYKVADGSPGVFYRLHEVAKGDEISVTSEDGAVKTFIINDISTYPINNFPLNYFFSADDARRLHIITCAGAYMPKEKNYTHRLVVYALLKA